MKPGPVDRDAVWGKCPKAYRHGMGGLGWVPFAAPLEGPRGPMGDGFCRRCMFCGFVWREDWVMKLVGDGVLFERSDWWQWGVGGA